jgi:hypothetical protein
LLLELHVNPLRKRSGNIFAYEIGFDGQFPVASVDQNGQLNAARTAEIVQGIHGRARRPPAEQHIIHQHYGSVVQVKRNNRRMNFGRRLVADIIAMHAHVHASKRYGMAPDVSQNVTQALRQMDAASLHTNDYDRLCLVILLGNFMGNPGQNAVDGG